MANVPHHRFEWTRLSQEILFDKRDDCDIPGSSFLAVVRMPPTVDGFPGFRFNGRNNLGIPDLEGTAALSLVGFVVEVTTIDLTVTQVGVSLSRPGVKLVYALLEDHTRSVHAVSLSTLRTGDVLRGLSVADFNFAGFPRGIGRTDPMAPQSLVLGIPRFYPNKSPPGCSPVLRLGWSYSDSNEFEALELVVANDTIIRPGTWLTYKLVELGTRRDLRDARRDSQDLDLIYRQARVSGARFGDPNAPESEYVHYKSQLLNQDISPYPYVYSSDEWSGSGMENSEEEKDAGVPALVDPPPFPFLGPHGVGAVGLRGGEGRMVGLLDDVCDLVTALANIGIFISFTAQQDCSEQVSLFNAPLCARHSTVYEALVEGLSAQVEDQTGNEEVRDLLVAQSKWWVPERQVDGQLHPPATGWTRDAGFSVHEAYFEDSDLIASDTRRSQLATINTQMALAYRLRCFYPEVCQPYPLFWPVQEPLPRDPWDLTLMWDLRTDFRVPGGPQTLVGTSLVAAVQFTGEWYPGYETRSGTTVHSPLLVSLFPVRHYSLADTTLGVGGTISSTGHMENCISFDAEHLSRATSDFPAYVSWCLEKWSARFERLLTPSAHSDGLLTHFLVGRIPIEFQERYSRWVGHPQEDLGLEAHLLQLLDPLDFEARRQLADRIWEEESNDLVQFGFVPAAPLAFNDPDFPFVTSAPLSPPSLLCVKKEPGLTTPIGPSLLCPTHSSLGKLQTHSSNLVLAGDPKTVNDLALSLSVELFDPPTLPTLAVPLSPLTSGIHTQPVPRGNPSLSFASPSVEDSKPRLGPSAFQSPSPLTHRSYGPLAASAHRSWKRPPSTQAGLTPELERAAALRLLRDDTPPSRSRSDHRHPDTPYPALGRIGTAILRSGSNGQGGNGPPVGSSPSLPAPPGSLRSDLLHEAPDGSPTSSDEPQVPGRAQPDHYVSTSLPLNFTTMPPPSHSDSASPSPDDETSRWARDNPDAHRATSGGPTYLKRMAIAAELKQQHKAQSDLYKDLGLHDYLTELMTNPTVGSIVHTLPSWYQMCGVGGQLAVFQPNMSGASRLNAAKNLFYHTIMYSNPELVVNTRVRFSPRLLIVFCFAIFRGPMALHPSDIFVVPDEQLLEMLSPKFHLGGKTLPSSGLGKLTPPDFSRVATTFTLLWEQLEHFNVVFCLFYGKMYELPISLLISDLKAIQRANFGFTPTEAAHLFSRTFAYHQDQIISAFTSGDLVEFKSIADLMHAYYADEVGLLSLSTAFPRLIPGSPAYIALYQMQESFFRRFHEEIGIRTLRAAADPSAVRKSLPPPKKPPTYGFLLDEAPPFDSPSSEEAAPPAHNPSLLSGANTPLSPPKPGPSTPPVPKRPRFPSLSTECLGRGLCALSELQKTLVASGAMPKDQEMCLRFLSHAGCAKCERHHVKPATLAGITLSPWLKILLIAHRGYRGDKAVTEVSASARLTQLLGEGSA